MPSKAIEKQPMPYGDILKCEGNMGFPAHELRMEVYDNTTNNYKTFFWPSGGKNNQTDQAGCLTTVNLSYHNLIFNLSASGKLFRCSAFDRSPTPRLITSTSSQSLNVLASKHTHASFNFFSEKNSLLNIIYDEQSYLEHGFIVSHVV
ncbi:hypothetical protein DPMN_138640 [Dreissena polymorpha]|uniref:Uncharacterized protein n=1 Tax=Dreissena polymorpha TaxID=45954 RepID=A0A9D4G480_DREPO|nr:hypothetical protein DPMN_138640 [Dreissena polymorpha]